ncbi:MAG TPA: cytochrome P450 [Kofleriaceae bacterium]|nr:cytochrome P450 [Kofleriaceae bacterium]
MVTLSSSLPPSRAAADIPALRGLPVLGNLLAFRHDRLDVLAKAAARSTMTKIALGPIPIYAVTCADLAREVLVDHAASFHKSAGLGFLRPLLGDGLLLAEGELHRRHRKLLAPAFAPKRIASYGAIMVEETRAQVARWSPGDRLDLADEMMQMTLAIAGRTLFGVDVRRDAATVAHGIELAMRSMFDNVTSPIRLGYQWPLLRHRRMRKAVRMLDAVVYRLIAEGRALGGDRGDVLSMLLLARDEEDGSALSDQQVRDEVMTLLLAGHETTANALTWAWFELGRNPEALERLQAEVDAVAGGRGEHGKQLGADDLPAMPWTAAVIEETMRLHPPAYVVSRAATEQVTIGGYVMPPGAILAVNIYEIHRRADYYPNPLAFRPERFLPEAKKARPKHHYLPFGGGPRVCIGSHFALVEAQLALATMVQHARVRPLKSMVTSQPLVTLRPQGGMPAVVERC